MVGLAGCGGGGVGAVGETDAGLTSVSVVGSWISGAGWLGAGDLVSVQIAADQRFLRVRCLDDGCARAVAEDGHWTLSRRTLKFYLEGANRAGTIDLHEDKLLDRWTVTVKRGVMTLARRDGSSVALGAVADADLCAASGGRWDGACVCGAGALYLAGEGGCMAAPVPSETLCDATDGSWTDDDINLLATYCECPRDSAWVDGTGCLAQ